MGIEKRKYKRIKIFPMTVKLVTDSKTFLGFISDLSSTGLLVCLHDNIADIDQFSIKIPLPKSFGSQVLTIDSHQVWVNQLSNLEYNQVGCEFLDVNDEQAKTLEQLISLLEEDDSDGADIQLHDLT
ncbi:MAG: hypothetical protein IEMM0008_1854 [bacterium]|nr:MAG: hypothetical protein IEMM0008_1854 [bacterium]